MAGNRRYDDEDDFDGGYSGGYDSYSDAADGGDDLAAALDFSSAPARYDDDAVVEVDAFGGYQSEPAVEHAADEDLAGVLGGVVEVDAEVEDETPQVPTYSVTNPTETVTVTTFMDGRVHTIELSPKAGSLTEGELADEIMVIAKLAAQKGRAGEYEFIHERMVEQGQEVAVVHDFLSQELKLPTPAQAADAQAAVFATRYAGEHD